VNATDNVGVAEVKAGATKLAILPLAVINKSGKFLVAKLDELNSISIETNIAFPFTSEGNEGITVEGDGKALTVKKVTSDEVKDNTTTFGNAP
jgi:hypothetical protein